MTKECSINNDTPPDSGVIYALGLGGSLLPLPWSSPWPCQCQGVRGGQGYSRAVPRGLPAAPAKGSVCEGLAGPTQHLPGGATPVQVCLPLWQGEAGGSALPLDPGPGSLGLSLRVQYDYKLQAFSFGT